MAKKAFKKKKPTRKKKRRSTKKSKLTKNWLLGLSIGATLLIIALIGVYFTYQPGRPDRPKKIEATQQKRRPYVHYEEPSITPPPLQEAAEPNSTLASRHNKPTKSIEPADIPAMEDITVAAKPMAAIVIDDMGHNRRIGAGLINLDLPLSFSFLPAGAHTRTLAQQAQEKKRDILVHMPMEPSQAKWDPGPDALYLNMSHQELRQAIRKNLAALPMAKGVNNHMGSRFTENWRGMEFLLHEIKAHNLYFFDSVTSSYTVGYILAGRLGIKTAKRDVFLDNVHDVDKIKKQLRLLIKQAKKNGRAVAIGHPHDATLVALREYQDILQRDLQLVGINKMVH